MARASVFGTQPAVWDLEHGLSTPPEPNCQQPCGWGGSWSGGGDPDDGRHRLHGTGMTCNGSGIAPGSLAPAGWTPEAPPGLPGSHPCIHATASRAAESRLKPHRRQLTTLRILPERLGWVVTAAQGMPCSWPLPVRCVVSVFIQKNGTATGCRFTEMGKPLAESGQREDWCSRH